MRYDLIAAFIGILCYAGGLHLIGGILLGVAFVVALRSK
jgi:hypothetical protein